MGKVKGYQGAQIRQIANVFSSYFFLLANLGSLQKD
jgi:hypothetical protein